MKFPLLPAPLVPEADLQGTRGDFLEAVRRGHDRYGDLFRLKFARSDIYMACHPDLAYEVLVKCKDGFAKLGAKAKTGLTRVLGNGLLTNTDTESWFAQRRRLQPFFHKNQVATWGSLCVQETEKLLGQWRTSDKEGRRHCRRYDEPGSSNYNAVGFHSRALKQCEYKCATESCYHLSQTRSCGECGA